MRSNRVGTLTGVKTPPDDLARKLTDASEQILSLDGQLKLDEVGRSVGVARATLYYYFSGRDDLLAFLVTHHLRLGGAAVAAGLAIEGRAEERLRAGVAALVRFLADHPEVCAGLLEAMGSGGRLAEVVGLSDQVIGGPLREILIEGRATGRLRFGDPADAANSVAGGALIAVLARAARGASLDDGEFAPALVDQLVGGLLA